MPPAAAAESSVTLLQSFANTLDVYDDGDALSSRADLTRWLQEQGLLARRTPSTEEDLALARRLRTGLRAAMAAHHDETPVDSPELAAATAELPLTLNCCGDGPHLTPVDSGVRGALGRLLVAINETVQTGEWERIKLCRDDECQWAYFDATKNRSKSWCGESCSNKAKTRTYRQRQKHA